jgi:hypothetical protein
VCALSVSLGFSLCGCRTSSLGKQGSSKQKSPRSQADKQQKALCEKLNRAKTMAERVFNINRLSLSVSNCWFPNSQAGASSEDFSLLMARSRGSSNTEDGRIGFGLVLELVEGQGNVFRRYGYFEQCW